MLSSGISESVYKKNMHRYFTVSPPENDDIDEISFISILDRSCSVSLINLSNEDIKAEKSVIKSMSSDPIRDSGDSTSVTESIMSPDDNKADDPDYGSPVKQTHITTPRKIRPGHTPSAARIAAQRIIVKTKGIPS